MISGCMLKASLKIDGAVVKVLTKMVDVPPTSSVGNTLNIEYNGDLISVSVLFIYFHGQMPESDLAVADASLQAVLFPEGNVFVPRLVYCVTVHPVAAIHTETGSAWIDARTGRVVMLFPVPI